MHQLAAFGNPIAHSRSPQIHLLFAEQRGLSIKYERVLVPIGEFDSYARDFIAQGGRGFSITAPFKNDAYRFVQRHSKAAAIAEAVNTISIGKDGMTVGDNTDGAGLMGDIIANLKWSVTDKRILILGAGGAVQGVVGDVLAGLPASVDIYNRTASKADHIVQRRRDERLRAVAYNALGSAYDLIVNGTSASLQGKTLALPASIISADTCCYDMSYGNSPFLNWCRGQGASETTDGLGMLVEQAALAFKVWFDVSVETNIVIETLRGTGNE